MLSPAARFWKNSTYCSKCLGTLVRAGIVGVGSISAAVVGCKPVNSKGLGTAVLPDIVCIKVGGDLVIVPSSCFNLSLTKLSDFMSAYRMALNSN